MAERPEDLNLPNAVVTRIIKEAIPSGVNIGKDARLAISKAASVFVLYATSCANNNALKSKRKTINVNDVFNALEDMEFDSFVDPLKSDLEAHKKVQASKKSKKVSRKSKDTPIAESEENTVSSEPTDATPATETATGVEPAPQADPADGAGTNEVTAAEDSEETSRMDTSS